MKWRKKRHIFLNIFFFWWDPVRSFAVLFRFHQINCITIKNTCIDNATSYLFMVVCVCVFFCSLQFLWKFKHTIFYRNFFFEIQKDQQIIERKMQSQARRTHVSSIFVYEFPVGFSIRYFLANCSSVHSKLIGRTFLAPSNLGSAIPFTSFKI